MEQFVDLNNKLEDIVAFSFSLAVFFGRCLYLSVDIPAMNAYKKQGLLFAPSSHQKT